MLQLKNITKDYKVGETSVKALRGIDLEFRQAEFVSILGPSGCGKTTLLNLIGGLDKYTSGEIMLEGKVTRDFTDSDWDAYRNGTVGFVFQSYNLISHQSVLDNVTIAMTLSGVSSDERKKKATDVLTRLGLADQIHKKPNQLSGGQMQRVAIARALVNNPKILMADEPTGALDSETSVQILNVLKEISKERLVIMVTHNQEFADEFSDRIIRLKDGLIVGDSNPIKTDNVYTGEKLINKKTSMSWLTALKLSFKNLLTKKKRTVLTAIAGSIGIIGVALVLAISSGMTTYVNSMQSDTLAGFPITISKTAMVQFGMGGRDGGPFGSSVSEFPTGDTIYSYDSSESITVHQNILTQEYTDYVDGMDKAIYNTISYSYGLEMAVVAKTDTGHYKKVNTSASSSFLGSSNSYFNEIPNNEDFIKTQYDVLSGQFPLGAGEAALIIDSNNRLDIEILEEFGITVADDYKFSDMIGRTFKVVSNNDFYTENNGIYTAGTDYASLYNNPNGQALKVVGIMRVKESASSEILSSGIGYTAALTRQMLDDSKASGVALAQAAAGDTINVLTGLPFTSQITYSGIMQKIGADVIPTGIQIYPKNFDNKAAIKSYLDAYNSGKAEEDQIIYSDLADSLSGAISTMINTIAIILAAFAAISLVVSTIMIGIITYVSVVERTKEIGILRAVGARKKDVTRIFNAETLLIGFAAGLLGVVITFILSIPINLIVAGLVGVSGIANLPIFYALLLIVGSMALTLIGGWLPARGAAKKDPVVALRTE